MSLSNKISVVFSTEEIQKLKSAIADISQVLQGKMQSLTPKERQTYARVKYEKQVWIDKNKRYMDQYPEKIPAMVDKAEFDRDYLAHQQLTEIIGLFRTQLEAMEDTHLLLGFDLDEAALIFYRFLKVAAENNDPNAITLYTDLKQQYPGGKRISTLPKKEE